MKSVPSALWSLFVPSYPPSFRGAARPISREPREGGLMADMKTVQVGHAVTYTDARGVKHSAIVTNAFGRYEGNPGSDEASSVNLVFASDDPNMEDQYGRQIARATSVVHRSRQSAPGMYWE